MMSSEMKIVSEVEQLFKSLGLVRFKKKMFLKEVTHTH